jgi:D-alanyl-D-alanine carboxypeptidase/D-alanyl-D-alanine-endopeptidase (penicillin-binding protein 4)
LRLVRGAVVAGLALSALAGCGGAGRPHHPSKTTTAAHAGATARSRPAAPKQPPALARLDRSLISALRRAGRQTGAAVYDLSAGRTLFSLRAEVMRPPASVEKLYTSVAVLAKLGPDTRLQTSVLGAGHLGPRGVWHGNAYLRGGGDPTFGDGAFNRTWEQGYGPTAAELADQLRRGGIRRITGRVIGDASLFDARRGVPSSGFAPDIGDLGGQLSALTYDHGGTAGHLSPGAFAARQLARTLRAAGVKVHAAVFTAAAPGSARLLAAASSPPMSVLLKLTDVPSDDFFAEMLTKQLGARFGGAGSTTAGASVISQVVSGPAIAPKIVDGSGLSREDRTSPLQVVDLLRTVYGTAMGRLLRAVLPVVGVTGTVQHIGVGTTAEGRCQAKTGTLDYVTNLAGFCDSRGGHVLAFALFLDGPSNTRAKVFLGRMVAAIARY